MSKVKGNRYCCFFVKSNNAQCQKKAIVGSNFCWLHYPKETIVAIVASVLLGAILGLLLPLLFNDKLNNWFSKYTPLKYCDKNNPTIESIVPDINKLSNVDKKTKIFKVTFLENDSGIDSSRSNIKINYKDNQKVVPLRGKVEIMPSEITFLPDRELLYGEYELEALLIDKADRKTTLTKDFVVQEEDVLGFQICYYKIEDCPDREIFQTYLEENKNLLSDSNLYVYYFTVSNKADKVQLRDLYIIFDVPGAIFDWKEVANFNTKGVHAYTPTDAFSINKPVTRTRFYGPQGCINIDNIGPHGCYSIAILVGIFKYTLGLKERNLWEGFEIYGTYIFEGYKSSEIRKIEFRLPLDQIELKKE